MHTGEVGLEPLVLHLLQIPGVFEALVNHGGQLDELGRLRPGRALKDQLTACQLEGPSRERQLGQLQLEELVRLLRGHGSVDLASHEESDAGRFEFQYRAVGVRAGAGTTIITGAAQVLESVPAALALQQLGLALLREVEAQHGNGVGRHLLQVDPPSAPVPTGPPEDLAQVVAVRHHLARRQRERRVESATGHHDGLHGGGHASGRLPR